MPVVTIARQFGAGGSEVARLLAARIGAECVDRALIAEVSRRMELAAGDVEAEDEHPSRLVDRLVRALSPMTLEYGMAWEPPYADPAFDPRQAVIDVEREVIREVAGKGDAVIVGRGAAFVLAGRTDVLHAFVVASTPTRVRRVMDRLGISEDEARRRVRETDENRIAYAAQLYGADWSDPVHYDLVLNTDRLGIDGAVAAIEAALAARAPARELSAATG